MSKPSRKKGKETIYTFITGLKFIVNGTIGINMLFLSFMESLIYYYFFPLLIIEKQDYLTTFNIQV